MRTQNKTKGCWDEKTQSYIKPSDLPAINWVAIAESHFEALEQCKAHAAQLADALRAWEYAGNEGGISMVDWYEVARKKTREALAAYEEGR